MLTKNKKVNILNYDVCELIALYALNYMHDYEGVKEFLKINGYNFEYFDKNNKLYFAPLRYKKYISSYNDNIDNIEKILIRDKMNEMIYYLNALNKKKCRFLFCEKNKLLRNDKILEQLHMEFTIHNAQTCNIIHMDTNTIIKYCNDGNALERKIKNRENEIFKSDDALQRYERNINDTYDELNKIYNEYNTDKYFYMLNTKRLKI